MNCFIIISVCIGIISYLQNNILIYKFVSVIIIIVSVKSILYWNSRLVKSTYNNLVNAESMLLSPIIPLVRFFCQFFFQENNGWFARPKNHLIYQANFSAEFFLAVGWCLPF